MIEASYQDLTQLIIGNISEFVAVVFWDNELGDELESYGLVIKRYFRSIGERREVYSVAFAEGVDVEECEDCGGFVEFEGGNIPWKNKKNVSL